MSTATRIAAFLVFLFAVANAYSKYGRTCKDIGCLSTEQCVMNEDPCNGYERDSCGRYPTCKKLNNGGSGGDCSTKNCPPGTQCITENGALICKNPTPGLVDEMFAEDMGGEPKDVARRQSTSEDTQQKTTGADPIQPNPNPNPVPGAGGSVYPELPKTNPVPSGYPAGSGYPASGGGGYPGYPAQNSGYPAPAGGYPGYPAQNPGGYPAPNPQYPNPYANANYPPPPQGGYPPQSGYPSQSNYNPNYPPPPQGYPAQGGYNPYGEPTSTTKKPGFFDKLAGEAKKLAKDFLKQTVLQEVNKSLNKAV